MLESPDVRALRLNGREIRNALQTAVALAETEALDDGVDTVMVAEKHLRAVVKMSGGFKSYLYLKSKGAGNWGDDPDDEHEEDEKFLRRAAGEDSEEEYSESERSREVSVASGDEGNWDSYEERRRQLQEYC